MNNTTSTRTKEAALAAVCEEFVRDVDAVGAETVAEKWPDLHTLYLKTKGILASSEKQPTPTVDEKGEVQPVLFEEIFNLWNKADAFKINGFVCGDFSLASPEDLAEEDNPVALNTWLYGADGFYREFFFDKEMIEGGRYEAINNTTTVNYYGMDVRITPLMGLTQA